MSGFLTKKCVLSGSGFSPHLGPISLSLKRIRYCSHRNNPLFPSLVSVSPRLSNSHAVTGNRSSPAIPRLECRDHFVEWRRFAMIENLSFEAFCDSIRDENECIRMLFQAKWPHGFRCPSCGHPHPSRPPAVTSSLSSLSLPDRTFHRPSHISCDTDRLLDCSGQVFHSLNGLNIAFAFLSKRNTGHIETF